MMRRAIEDVIRVSPAGEPAEAAAAATPPWDLSRYVPTGNGLFDMATAMPYQAAPPSYPFYALYQHVSDPFLGAPINEVSGGTTMYFEDLYQRDDFDTLMRIFEVDVERTDYVAYVERTREVGTRAFATQLRIITRDAFVLFGGGRGPSDEQPLAIGDALWSFMKVENPDLTGSLGGHGDETECVAHGFLIENSYFGVYRIWNRPRILSGT